MFCLNSRNEHRRRWAEGRLGLRCLGSLWPLCVLYSSEDKQIQTKTFARTIPTQISLSTNNLHTLYTHVNTHKRACNRASHVGFPDLPTAPPKAPREVPNPSFSSCFLHPLHVTPQSGFFSFLHLRFHDRKITNRNPSSKGPRDIVRTKPGSGFPLKLTAVVL